MQASWVAVVSVAELSTRIFNGVLIAAQACLIDYFMVSYGGFPWLGWIAGDIVVLATHIALTFLAYRYFAFKRTQAGLLPFSFILWILYSCLLAAKVATMFKTFARDLPAEGWMGTNLMKIAIGMAAGVFAVIIAGHHRGRSSERHRFCLKWMQTHVVFELLDTVEFLSILFINEDQLLVSFAVENAIIGYSCINLVVPAVALYQLSSANFGHAKPKENLILIQSLLALLFVNIPYVIIRLYLWHKSDFTTALFIMKNFIAIVNTFWELRGFIPCCRRLHTTQHEVASADSVQMADFAGAEGKNKRAAVSIEKAVPGSVDA